MPPTTQENYSNLQTDSYTHTISDAVASDQQEVAGLLYHHYATTENRFEPLDVLLDGIALVKNDPRSEFLVARNQEGKPIACLLAAGYEIVDSKSAEHLKITSLIVHPDYRGRGIARQLHDEIVCHAKAQGYKALTLDVHVINPAGISFWRHMGYQIPGYIAMQRPLS